MAAGDPITERQLDYIITMARQALELDWHEWTDEEVLQQLDDRVGPVYEIGVAGFNRGQAGMLIETLKYEIGETNDEPEHPSIF